MDFLKQNKRFSFKLDGADAWQGEYTVETDMPTANEYVTAYLFKNGLKVTNVAKKYDKFGAYEWVNYFENTSDKPTGIISELWDCDCVLDMEYEADRLASAYHPDAKTATKIYAPCGSNWSAMEFYCDIDTYGDPDKKKNHIFPGTVKRYSSCGGRSSHGDAPFFNIFKNNKGYIVAVGWSGQWNCDIGRTNDTISVKTKIEDTNFRLLPGESFRTSSVIIMPYTGDFADSQNIWRRLVKEELSPMGKNGRAAHGPLCAGVWGGMRSTSVIDRVNKIKENKFPFEYIWMDAGWYGEGTMPTSNEFEGDWWTRAGDWRISKNIHPQEMKDVSKAIHDAGMKFLLWFEPERAMNNTPAVKEHPEYFLRDRDKKENWSLLNLGDEAAWDYCYGVLEKHIKELEIDCYRQDFNCEPLERWRANDAEDRKGITEIKYINGFYKLWDALLDRFPGLIIDNCASGGRRIDIETLKRSIPLWRSDFQCSANFEPEGTQCHTLTYNLWMPYSGSGAGRIHGEYEIRSAYADSMTTNYSFAEDEEFCDTQEKIDFIKKYTNEYLKVRAYFCEDIYPLAQVSDTTDSWCAVQFDRPSQNDGMVQVFRRENSPYETASFMLREICADKTYRFTDLDGGEFDISGKDLAENGLHLTVAEKRKAKIYIYKAV